MKKQSPFWCIQFEANSNTTHKYQNLEDNYIWKSFDVANKMKPLFFHYSKYSKYCKEGDESGPRNLGFQNYMYQLNPIYGKEHVFEVKLNNV